MGAMFPDRGHEQGQEGEGDDGQVIYLSYSRNEVRNQVNGGKGIKSRQSQEDKLASAWSRWAEWESCFSWRCRGEFTVNGKETLFYMDRKKTRRQDNGPLRPALSRQRHGKGFF